MRHYPKFTQRVLQCKTNATVRRVQTLSAIPYSHLRQREYSSGEEISIAISVVAFNGELRFLQESLDSLLRQSHQALEIIIIDNGTTGQHHGLVNEAFHADPRVVLLRFPQHYFLPAAPDETNSWPIMANAALFATDCYGFFPLSYDDQVDPNYAHCMAQLFQSNELCTTAAPLAASIDQNSRLNVARSDLYKNATQPAKFTRGTNVVRALINGTPTVTAPGEVLCVKVDEAIRLGGFDLLNDHTQFLRLASTGYMGFDGGTRLLWRHHEHQTNRSLMRRGHLFAKDYLTLDSAYDVGGIYEEMGQVQLAGEVRGFLSEYGVEVALLGGIRQSCYEYGVRAGFRALVSGIRQSSAHYWLSCLRAYGLSLPRACLVSAASLKRRALSISRGTRR